MKYGLRERVSGAVIIVALAVIFVPMLFDEPTPREERPQPVMTIDQPIEVERTSVPDPEPPESLGNGGQSQSLVDSSGSREAVEGTEQRDASEAAQEVVEVPRIEPADEEAPPEVRPEVTDPIAEMTRSGESGGDAESASEAPPASGGWTVQAGSFGQSANAERLERELEEQGFEAYRRQRDGGLTSVYVGPFESSEAGERARTELKERANIQGLLVRIREDE